MKTLKQWIVEATEKLKHFSSQPRQEALWLAEYLLIGKKISCLSDQLLTKSEIEKLNQLILRRTLNEPLGYIIGFVPFLDTRITIIPPILIPRAETEEMVDWLITTINESGEKQITIADVCTGSGCIAIALGKAIPEAKILATDISPEAIHLSLKNIAHNQIKNVTVRQGNQLEPLQKNSYDIIVCNPPYLSAQEWQNITSDVKDWESKAALTDEHDGLTWYRLLASEAKKYLKQNKNKIPRIMCEIGHTQGIAVQDIFKKENWQDVTIHKDLSQKDRWVTAS